ncbi:MAG: iron uptake porin [Nostocaceae cyanobacterium]|nr:iron uptake porin [Nostocaceae cyanobacterium]
MSLNVLCSTIILGITDKSATAQVQIKTAIEEQHNASEADFGLPKDRELGGFSDEDNLNSQIPNPELSPVEVTPVPQAEETAPVTPVSQLSDVKPTDWAYGALQSLMERYGCIAGYPDGTFRGIRAINRYEFAAALSACMETANQMVEKITDEYANQEELEVLRRLQAEFAQELADFTSKLESMPDKIDRMQEMPAFSANSELVGKAVFGISAVGGNDVDGNTVFSQRTELNIDTSFAGKDRLRVRLTARNTPRFNRVTGTDMANLSFSGDNNNDLEVNQVSYRFRPIESLQVLIAADGGSLTNFTSTLNSPINSSAIGNVGKFSDESAIYDLGGSTGVGMEYRFSDAVRLSLGYMAGDANKPQRGIAGGAYGAIAQLTLEPTENWSLGLTYVRAYNTIDTAKGSEFANEPFEDAATSANAYGIQTSWRVNQALTVSGWVGLINATAESEPYKGSTASILTWATTLAVNDIGGEGNMLGLIFGQPPKAISNDVASREDPDTALHLEAFYRYRISDKLYITPGFFVILNPEHNAGNDPVFVGTIRKTFLF